MPKVLSLKKVQQTCPPKNQKPITQFFKNTSINNAQKTQSSNDPNQSVPSDCMEKVNKRKAPSPSPVASDTIEVYDGPHVRIKSTKSKDNCKNIKKFKPNNQDMSIKNTVCTPVKKSLKKENELSINQSPPSNSNNDHNISNGEQKVDTQFSSTNDFKRDNERSPLAPVTIDNVNSINTNLNNVKICLFDNENHVNNGYLVKTPVEFSPSKNHDHNKGNSSEKKRTQTPKKSPIQEFGCSPISKLRTPEKSIKDILSPSKCGSTVKVLDFTHNDVCELFDEEWEVDNVEEDGAESLDLSTMQRCEVLSVIHHPNRLELRLKNNNQKGTCFVEGIWLDTPITQGEVLSIIASRDSSGQYCVGNGSGLLVLRPDHLVSSTSVVAGVFCKRRAVLQERWKGIDPSNTAMTIGIIIHELVQKALTQNISNLQKLRVESERIIKESIQMLFDAGLSEEEARSNIQMYLQPLAEFMQTYVCGRPLNVKTQKGKENWPGHIDKVLDIEENVCCPQLGLKGKIDATLQVTIHDKKEPQKAVVPLELKSGKASMSAEHRGQLVLYGMMLSAQRRRHPAARPHRGLLLYLRDSVELREVSCGYPERRDLMMLRNQLVQYLAKGPEEVDPEQLTDIEDASILLQQRLPDPIHHANACAKCPYLTLCSLHLWHTDGPSVSQNHPLSKLQGQALGHLLPAHIKYFLNWTALLKMEERGQMNNSPLHALWTDSVEKRMKRGTCAANLNLKHVHPSGDRYVHVFTSQEFPDASDTKATKGPQEGEFSIVSLQDRPWIAAGVVIMAKTHEIHMLLERDLSRRLKKDTVFHIDTYESYATTVQNLTNLGVLMEDSDRAERLRKLIIDKASPEFDEKLPREVGRLGTKLMRSLNIEQQRAVLRALAARDYALLQGLPGTGKTQTICVLIQMLVALKQRVLVTAHTHSAVDTVLSRLPESVRVMRLGSTTRVAATLQARSEQALTSSCKTPEDLSLLYDSMEVVGVTCLGAAHAMLARTTFDVCIVDEATQVLQCTVLRPLFAAKRFVLVGDPEQLPPVVKSRAARRLGMEESLFHRLMNEDVTSTLRLQYRMNQPLADIANRVAYRARLKCADRKVADACLNIHVENISARYPWLLKACGREPESAAIFLDLASTDTVDDSLATNQKTCTNIEEACVVIALVEALKEGGVQATDIGVIAPYRDQVSLLRRSLAQHMVEVSTVDQFQGRDKSVIIYSCTKRDRQDDRKVKDGEVLNDQRRLAVSVTRAKHKLLIIGNSRALLRYTPLQRLIDACATLQLDKNTVTMLCHKYGTTVGN